MRLLRLFIALLVAAAATVALPVAAQAADVGAPGPSYAGDGVTTPTADKAQSKLWFQDGSWWGLLWSASANATKIHRLDVATQAWQETDMVVDARPNARGDALWDAKDGKLYVVSGSTVLSEWNSPPSQAAVTSGSAALHRFSYNAATKTYSRDAGFPVTLHSGSTESITVAKDSVGKLWVTYTVVSADNSNRVYVNHSTTSDTAWATPFVLPTTNAQVHHDDISAVTSFQGDKIGIMWSNQRGEHKRFYFAIHQDGQPENSWQTEVAYGGGVNCTGGCANDHLNLRQLTSDGSGRLYAAIKTAHQNAGQTFVALLVRDARGQWTSTQFSVVEDLHTRPMVMIDEEHREIWMFAVAPEEGGTIYYKKTPIDNVSFAPGAGTPIISSSTDRDINDPTSTKQNVNGQTGLVLLAAARTNERYWHAHINLGTGQSAIAAKAASLNGSLGAATTAEVYGLRNNGGFQCFERGCILYSPATGAHVSLGAIRGKWAQTGYENGGLGYPVTDEVAGLRDGGVYQNYQGGAIMWSPATGAHISVGAIRARWAETGYENGRLRYPVTDEVGGLRNGGVYQNYQGGAIIYSPASGAHLSVGGIRTIWASTGYESGRLGYPTSEEYATANGGVAQNYQGGVINLTPSGHTITWS